MRPSTTPEPWEDRRLAARNVRPRNSLEERVRALSDADIKRSLDHLTVVSFDPGETTGWSVMKVSFEKLFDRMTPVHLAVHTWYQGQIDCGSQIEDVSRWVPGDDGIPDDAEALGSAVMAQIVERQFVKSHAVAVVIEDFILRTQNKKREALSPVRISSRLEQVLWETDDVTVTKQQPSVKASVTDDRLKLWGLYVGGHSERHARDADRHALHFLRGLRGDPPRAKRAYPVVAEAKARGLL